MASVSNASFDTDAFVLSMDIAVRKRVILSPNVCKLQSSYICGDFKVMSEMALCEAGFNELMRVLLDSFSKQERALFLEEHKGEQGNGFRPCRWCGHGCSFQLRIPALARVLFNRSYSASWLLRKASVRCFFMSCMLVDFPVKTSPRWGVASTVTTTANSR